MAIFPSCMIDLYRNKVYSIDKQLLEIDGPMQRFIDQRFYLHRGKYIAQCFEAAGVVFLALYSLTMIANTVVIASIGSTAFSVFVSPHKSLTEDITIIMSYIVGMMVGTLCWFAFLYLPLPQYGMIATHYSALFGAVAVGLTMFLLVILDFEHPPAVSLALGLVIDKWSLPAIVVTVFGVTMILGLRYMLRRRLINLI